MSLFIELKFQDDHGDNKIIYLHVKHTMTKKYAIKWQIQIQLSNELIDNSNCLHTRKCWMKFFNNPV